MSLSWIFSELVPVRKINWAANDQKTKHLWQIEIISCLWSNVGDDKKLETSVAIGTKDLVPLPKSLQFGSLN